MRKLAYVFLILGIAIILYPGLMEWHEDRQTSQMLKLAEQASLQDTSSQSTSEGTSVGQSIVNSYKHVSNLLENTEDDERTSSQEIDKKRAEDQIADPSAIGVIEIDRIDVELPILEGATKQNMKHAAVHMSETASPGQPGNAAIAAHRAHTPGRLFNRLDEVVLGDEVKIRTHGQEYLYEVIQIKVVEPTDISVLNNEGDDRLLTLITCDPLINPTHRLIVQARIM